MFNLKESYLTWSPLLNLTKTCILSSLLGILYFRPVCLNWKWYKSPSSYNLCLYFRFFGQLSKLDPLVIGHWPVVCCRIVLKHYHIAVHCDDMQYVNYSRCILKKCCVCVQCEVSSVIVHQLSWTGTVHPQCVLLPLRVLGPFTAFHFEDEWSLQCS